MEDSPRAFRHRISRRPKPCSTSCAREIGPYFSAGSTVTTEPLETEPRSRTTAHRPHVTFAVATGNDRNTSTPAVRRVRGRYYAPASHCLATKVSTKPTRGTLNG